jgi:sugar (pentulose or hexulose) kinase
VISLGVDVGTTRIKVLAVDIDRRAGLALRTAPTPVRRDADGEAHDPSAILEAVVSLLADTAKALPDAALVTALSCASVGEEVVLLDEARRPLGDAIAWYDPRGTAEAQAFLAGPGGEVALSRDFLPDPTFSLFKLLWTRTHRPELLSRAAIWTDLGDFVLLGLGAEVAMDWTHASRAGAFDLATRRWDAATLDAAALTIPFPPLVPSGTVVGTLSAAMAARTGLSTDVRLVTGGHDHLCAAYGAGLRTGGELFLSAGTSEAHLALLPAPVIGRPRDASPYHVDQGCYVDAGSWYAHVNIHSGHVFRQWRSLLYEGVDDVSLYADLEAVVPGPDGPVFDLLDDLRRGRLDRLPYTAGRDAILRAVLEGLARRSGDIVSHLERVVGRSFERILAVGLPTAIPLWRSLRDEAYAGRLDVVDEPEMTALGAALLAAQTGTA